MYDLNLSELSPSALEEWLKRAISNNPLSPVISDMAGYIRKQAERIAELEARLKEQPKEYRVKYERHIEPYSEDWMEDSQQCPSEETAHRYLAEQVVPLRTRRNGSVQERTRAGEWTDLHLMKEQPKDSTSEEKKQMTFRTDRNRNPTAFTVDIAKEAGLILGVNYENGESFQDGDKTYYTAMILGDPVRITIEVINKLGFYNSKGELRWSYIAIPFRLWLSLSPPQKLFTIGYMYNQEGGVEMKDLFPQSL